MNSALFAYLDASRRLESRVGLEWADTYYARLYDHLKLVAPSSLPPLTVIYSTERSCQIVKAAGEWHLIYDQYLGETFDLLTRILYHAQIPAYAEAFAIKSAAQRLVSRGRFPEAAYLILYFAEMQPREALAAISEDNRKSLTPAHELFVMAHEACHFLMRHDEHFRAGRVEAAEVAFSYALNRLGPDRIPSLELRLSICRNYGIPVQKRVWKRSARRTVRLWRKYHATHLEEVKCDLFALDVVLKYVQGQGLNPWIGFIACFLALRYIRILHYCDAIADSLITGSDFELMRERGRINHMREEIVRHRFLSDMEGNADSRTKYDEIVTADNGDPIEELTTKFAKVLHDPISYHLPELLENIRRDFDIRHLPKNKYGQEIPDHEVISVIDEITGRQARIGEISLPNSMDSHLSTALAISRIVRRASDPTKPVSQV